MYPLPLDGSYQVLQGFETRVETPLLVERPAYARGGTRGASMVFDTPKEFEEDEDGCFFKEGINTYHPTAIGGGAVNSNKQEGRLLATKVSVPSHGLYDPNGLGMGICGGIFA